MKIPIRKIWIDLLNLFYPNLCILCENPLVEGEEQVCSKCLNHLPFTQFQSKPGNPVECLLIDRIKVTHATAYLHFEQGSSVQKLIHSIKYYGKKELGFLFGKLAAVELQATDSPLCQAEIIIPIPLHRRKQRKRGYNQSEWIAQGMASVLNIPVSATAVQRDKMTESQTQKTGYNRWENVRDIFSVTDPSSIEGKHILLVDDVITSGSTAVACIDALSEIEGIQISFFTLSIAPQ